MDRALSQLGRQLLAAAAPTLLDAPLPSLWRELGDDEARELLVAVHESGHASRLRDLLADDGLAIWASGHCTAREEELLCAQLRRWLSAGASGDDPARLLDASPGLEPPRDARALAHWAEKHGLEALLARPARDVLGDAYVRTSDVRLLDLCLSQGARSKERGASLLATDRAEAEARAHVTRAAAHVAALDARKALHARSSPEGRLGLLTLRLRALLDRTPLEAVHDLRFVPARPVALEPGSGRATAAIARADGAAPIHVALALSGFEQRGLEGTCDACAGGGCLHLKALAARLLDAALDLRDRLHPALVEVAEVPSWQRFLSAVAPPETAASSATDSLSFAVRVEEDRLSIGVLRRRVDAQGRLSAGKLVAPQAMLRGTIASDRDREVLTLLAARTRTLSAQYLQADPIVLRSLIDHPALSREGTGEPVRIVEERLAVRLHEQPEGLLPEAQLAGRPLPKRAARGTYVIDDDAVAGRLTFAALTPALERLLAALAHFRGVLPPESYGAIAPWLSSLDKVAVVDTPEPLVGRATPAPQRLLLRITPLLDTGIDVSISVRALPLAPLYRPGQGPELVHGLVAGEAQVVRRDLEHERTLGAALCTDLGLSEHVLLAPFAYRIEETQEALAVLSRAARRKDVLELEWAERARTLGVRGSVRAEDLKVSLFKRGAFLALEGGAIYGDHKLAVDRLLDAARTGERFVPIGGGDYVEIEQELFDRLATAELSLMSLAAGLALPRGAVRHWLAQFGEQTTAGDPDTASLLARAHEGAALPVAPVDDAVPGLRAYQREGVAFLRALSSWAGGACLADEMGLGKTVQAIALLVERAAQGPALVVAPTSLVDNWLRELARFAPTLNARPFRGAERAAPLDGLGPHDVLVTSYDLLLRDRDRFTGHALATLVLDEAQMLKNARTLRARAVASLDASFRVALSGTPIENRLGDLWSLFQLIEPGLFGSWSRFRARFAVPIERYDDQERARVLRGLVTPFVLRREKLQVAAELPPRTEVVQVVTLSRAERDLYDAALAHARRAIGKRRAADDTSRTVQILAELTRLRQLACHPRLVLGDSRVSSSKHALLHGLLDDLLPRGHRVLVFSQFVRHLQLVREALEARGVEVLMLTGATPATERAARVARFQNGGPPVFLVSLKAGGTGLNLTAADYVVHLDPWWNPSAEEQASDRAHRIGQTRPVTIVKLVSQGTIEERVLGLHVHKRRLARAIVGGSREGAGGVTDLALLEELIESA